MPRVLQAVVTAEEARDGYEGPVYPQKEYILDDDECPLAILMNHSTATGEYHSTGQYHHSTGQYHHSTGQYHHHHSTGQYHHHHSTGEYHHHHSTGQYHHHHSTAVMYHYVRHGAVLGSCACFISAGCALFIVMNINALALSLLPSLLPSLPPSLLVSLLLLLHHSFLVSLLL
ncbi:hypothetical protein FHG87_026065 [Trinorchestia longiramus]|nr:hypothetical protein FHG87_026065 [Trinorchestia longiramus]